GAAVERGVRHYVRTRIKCSRLGKETEMTQSKLVLAVAIAALMSSFAGAQSSSAAQAQKDVVIAQRTPRRTMRVAQARRKWARARARNRAIRAQQRKTTRRRSTSRLAATPRPALMTIKGKRAPRRMTTKIQTGNGRVGSMASDPTWLS